MAGAESRGPRRETRGTILVAAGRVFGRLGYAGTRVEDILQEAAVSRATFYKFFESKEAVFLAIEESFDFSFMQAMSGVDTGRLAPLQQAEEFIDVYLRWIVGWRGVARVMWTDPTRPRAGVVIESRTSAHQAFLELVKRVVIDIGVSDPDPFVLRGLLGAISEVGMALIEAPRTSDTDIDRARAAIVRLAAAALTPIAN